ncbi:MAG TPA: hypothetical protein VLS44_11120 [Nitrospira sp.]|nr:hypothetical protein [Nitrospira sp.]
MTRARNVSSVNPSAGPALVRPVAPDPTPLILASSLEPGQLEATLHAYNIQRVKEADANLQAMAGEPHHRRQLAAILALLLDSVSRTADPDQALNHWERLLSNVSRSSFLEYLRSSPRMLDLVCTIFGNSDSLAFTLIRDPMLIYWLAEQEVLSKPPTRAGLERAIQQQLGQLTASELKLDALRRFRRREMLRIGVRDVLKLADVPETTGALSDLASVLIDAAYRVVDADLQAEHGTPMHKNRQGKWVETGFTVIGMGKLGGHELNYSSDVDVLYICESHDGETRAPKRKGARAAGKPVTPISNEEYFEHLARRLTRAISEQTHEGYIFRVDLRLRAEGSVGQLTRSLEDYEKYYRTRGVVWERLALLKAWPIAGSTDVGKAFLRTVKPFIFGSASAKPDLEGALAIVRDVRAVKDMIDAKMADRGHERRNVKLGVGGIREIEFFVQTIQVLAGKRLPALLDRSTLGALKRFVRLKLISAKDRDALTAAYVFLRDAEHKLQMVHDLQTHSLPDQAEELERCAIRMGYTGMDRSTALKHFQADHAAHTAVVHDLFRAFFESPKSSVVFKATLRAMSPRS